MSKNKYKENDEQSLDLYLKEIGNYPLITVEEEIELAKRVKQGDTSAFEKLAQANLRFVVSVAKQYQNQGMALSDLINEGNIGLMKAVKRFDETRGFKFVTYAVWWIRQAILNALADQSRIVRLPLNRVGTIHKIGKISANLQQENGREPSTEEIAEELGLSEKDVADALRIENSHLSLDYQLSNSPESETLLDVIEDEFQPSPEDNLLEQGLIEEIAKALATLTPREAEVITLFFNLHHEKRLTLEEIGARFSITRERVRQIKEKALKRLRHVSRSRKLREYLDDLKD